MIYPLSKVSLDDTRMEFKCVVCIPVLRYVEMHYGRQKLEEFIADQQMHLPYLENPNNWISHDFYCRLLDQLVELTGFKRAPFEAARLYSNQSTYRIVGLFLTHLGSPGSVYRLIPQFHHVWNKVSEWHLRDFSDHRCRIEVTYPDHDICENNSLALAGSLAAVPHQFGLPSAEVREVTRQQGVGGSCLYEMTWTSAPERAGGKLGAVLGFVLGGVSMAVAGWSLGMIPVLLLLTGGGYLWGRVHDYKMRFSEFYRRNQEQANSLLETMRATEQVNRELNTHVDTRTEELAKANEALQSEVRERQQAERKLRQSEEMFRNLFSSSSDALLLLKGQVIVDGNQAAKTMFEADDDAGLKNWPFRNLFPEKQPDGETSQARIDACLEEAFRRNSCRMECRQKTPSGRFFDAEILFSSMTVHDERMVQATIRDITARKQRELALQEAKRAAEEASQMKSRFLANVSHEIRTPLNSIVGFSEIIQGSQDVTFIHRQIAIILQEARILLMLINALLDHAKIEAGKIDLEKRPFDLKELCDRIQRISRREIEDKGLRFHVMLKDDVPQFVVGDVLRLYQVLLNLVTNAVKFTDKGGICLLIDLDGEVNERTQIRFSVIDTGIGIPKEKRERIFASFSQVDDRIAREYGGTGLGLTIAYQLVELMGGELGLDSEEGKGSTFYCSIPFEVCKQVPSRDALVGLPDERSLVHGGKLPQRSGRVLLVDDYEPNQEVARLHLESLGFSVDVVGSGHEAVAQSDQHLYDIILMDVQMPAMDGTEAARRIHAHTRNAETPILAMTANVDSDVQQQCLDAGMGETIIKPVRRMQLLQILDRWLLPDAEADERVGPIEYAEQPEACHEVLAFQRAVDEFGGNHQAFWAILKKFMQARDEEINRLKSGVDNKNYADVQARAHRIAGGAANLCAFALCDACRALECEASKRDAVSSGEGVQRVLEAFEALEEKVRSMGLTPDAE